MGLVSSNSSTVPATGLHFREQSSTWSCLGRKHIGTTVIGIVGILA